MEQHDQMTHKRTVAGSLHCAVGMMILMTALSFSMSSLAQMPKNAAFTVVIDAGHGGKDPGAVGKNSYEKSIALGIAKKTGYYIENLMPDVRVIYTRKTDVFLDLDRRANIANKADADLFMSIHVDGFGTPNAYGTSSYVMGATMNENNLALAMKENKVIELEEDYSEKYKDYDPNDLTSHIALNVMQGAYEKQSLDMAARVQDQFRNRAKRRDRGVHSAPLLVLWHTTMPSVLIETGFITNPKEEQFLNTDYGQDLVASAIYRAFREYKTDIEQKTTYTAAYRQAQTELKQTNSEDQVKGSVNLTDILSLADESNPLTESQSATAVATKNGSSQQTKIKTNDTPEFRVQILASENQIPLTDKVFKGQKDLEEIKEGVYYKYVTRAFTNYDACKILQRQLSGNFSGAFIVAYKNGKKIPVQDALKMLE